MEVQGKEVTSSCDVRTGSRREVSQIINKAQLGDGEMEKGRARGVHPDGNSVPLGLQTGLNEPGHGERSAAPCPPLTLSSSVENVGSRLLKAQLRDPSDPGPCGHGDHGRDHWLSVCNSVGVWSVKTDLMDCVPPAPPHPGSSSGQAQNGTPLAPVSQGAREHSVLSDHTGVPVNMGYECEISRCESCPVRKRHCYVCIHALAQAGHRMACWDSGPASLGRAWEGGGAAAHWDRPTLIYTPILLPLCLDRGGAKSVPDGLSC
ncbi:hypothetical protein SRHO_G00080160 [Serrasalmus rhombeus]